MIVTRNVRTAVTAIVLAFLATAALVVMPSRAQAPAEGDLPAAPSDVVLHVSPYAFDETIARFERIIARFRSQDGVLIDVDTDFAANAASVGEAVRPTTVLVFDHFARNARLVRDNPVVALDLPVRVLVLEDETGRTLVAHRNPAALVELYALSEARPVADDIQRAVDSVVAAAIGEEMGGAAAR